jgi:hypothetical protein
MREIKFRAIERQVGNQPRDMSWIYGSLIIEKLENEQGEVIETPLIYTGAYEGKYTYVDPATVCEFTGFVLKNGIEIFEWDVFKGANYFYVVLMLNGQWVCKIIRPKKLIGIKIPLYEFIEGRSRRLNIAGDAFHTWLIKNYRNEFI